MSEALHPGTAKAIVYLRGLVRKLEWEPEGDLEDWVALRAQGAQAMDDLERLLREHPGMELNGLGDAIRARSGQISELFNERWPGERTGRQSTPEMDIEVAPNASNLRRRRRRESDGGGQAPKAKRPRLGSSRSKAHHDRQRPQESPSAVDAGLRSPESFLGEDSATASQDAGPSRMSHALGADGSDGYASEESADPSAAYDCIQSMLANWR
ncbi:hypothetical protein BV25DRAFT_1916920 [Artomyces pyxidatus]|uniref:Uncharacterized protein n=1 Tax=Artomyces pyxidatus TaxID=48021 RepID=A0ACB8SZM9_9AGAM|nr:hypothetical protein BV25DRAFT_1916920 [Artomyces pyxidatus]